MLLIETEILETRKRNATLDEIKANPQIQGNLVEEKFSLPAVFDADTGITYVDFDGHTAVIIDGKTSITFAEPLAMIMTKLVAENSREQGDEEHG